MVYRRSGTERPPSLNPDPFPKRESPPFNSIFHLTSPAQNGNPETAVLIFENPAQAKRLAKFFVGKILQEGRLESCRFRSGFVENRAKSQNLTPVNSKI
jgi:hypothetical protein